MIDKKELRIGNHIDYEATTHIITDLNEITCSSVWVGDKTDYKYQHSYKNILPIELTEEKLLELGFKESVDFISGIWLVLDGDLSLSYNQGDIELWDVEYIRTFPDCKLHQLQNLVYSLTGKEIGE